MQYYRLERLINLFDGYRKTFQIDATHLLLLQQDGERYLVESFCPHREQPLNDAAIDNGRIICPHHAYCFELQSGRLLEATEEPCRDLRTFDLVYRDNEVGVML